MCVCVCACVWIERTKKREGGGELSKKSERLSVRVSVRRHVVLSIPPRFVAVSLFNRLRRTLFVPPPPPTTTATTTATVTTSRTTTCAIILSRTSEGEIKGELEKEKRESI